MKRLNPILFILFCLLSTYSIAQKQGQAKIDSLLIELKNYKSPCKEPCIGDSSRILLLKNIAWELSVINPDTALIICNEIVELSKKIKLSNGTIGWPTGIGHYYHQVGWLYYNKGENLRALQYYTKALSQWDSILANNDKNDKTSTLISKSATLSNAGIIYAEQGDYDKALNYFFKALQVFDKLKSKDKMATIFSNIGIIYKEKGDNASAIACYLKALNITKELGNKNEIARQLGNIGNFYSDQGQYSKALDYLFRAIRIEEELGRKNEIAAFTGNIGAIYFELKNYSTALNYYMKAIEIDEKFGYKNGMEKHLGYIGNIYYIQRSFDKALNFHFKALNIAQQLGDKAGIATAFVNIGLVYKEQLEFNKALNYNFKALSIAEEISDKITMTVTLGNIGSLYIQTKKYEEAKKFLQKSLIVADEIGSIVDIKAGNENLSDLYAITANYKEALDHYKKAVAAKDSLFNEEKTKEITRLEMNYEFDKKETATKAEQEKKDAVAKQELEKQKVIRNSIAGGAGIIVLSSLFSFFFYKRKRDAEQKQKETSLNLQVSETEMKALRSQMNPHFIFNALQSIQTFLLSNKSEDANNYLLKFSKLMRAVLENSQHSEVSLKEDLLALELYMQLESIRLPHPFTYQFHIDESINLENDTIPPLILQPFVENAIWHGLQYKTESGNINIFISKKNNALYATVEDNGVGRDMSKQVAQPMLLKKESLGLKLTEQRLKLYYEQKKIKAEFKITDLFTRENEPSGTKVELSLPLAS